MRNVIFAIGVALIFLAFVMAGVALWTYHQMRLAKDTLRTANARATRWQTKKEPEPEPEINLNGQKTETHEENKRDL